VIRDRIALLVERARGVIEFLSQAAARHLQPRIARQLLDVRPEVHADRQRVHYLVVLTELAKLRRFPEEHQ